MHVWQQVEVLLQTPLLSTVLLWHHQTQCQASGGQIQILKLLGKVMGTGCYLKVQKSVFVVDLERSSWHTYLKGKSNYHKLILDARNKSGQSLACMVVKQAANDTASGSLNVLAWTEKTELCISPLAFVFSLLLLFTRQLAMRAHPWMQLLNTYISHLSFNQSLKVTVLFWSVYPVWRKHIFSSRWV